MRARGWRGKHPVGCAWCLCLCLKKKKQGTHKLGFIPGSFFKEVEREVEREREKEKRKERGVLAVWMKG